MHPGWGLKLVIIRPLAFTRTALHDWVSRFACRKDSNCRGDEFILLLLGWQLCFSDFFLDFFLFLLATLNVGHSCTHAYC